jgi:hypothetical protein
MSFRCLLVAGLCLTLAEISVSAQTTARYTLAGIVRDTTGAVLVSVDVNLTPTDGGDTRTIVTDPMGRFTFPSLLPGAYRVSAVTAGFSEAASLVHIAAEPLTTVELVMHVVMTEHVEVSTSLDAPVATSLASTTLTGAALEALPDDPGALLQRVRELAGATDGVGQVAVMVDGFTGGLWLPPKQAIQAIRISSNWFAAEFAEPGQARIDIITKPGTNTVHGDLRVNVNNEAMNARTCHATSVGCDAGRGRIPQRIARAWPLELCAVRRAMDTGTAARHQRHGTGSRLPARAAGRDCHQSQQREQSLVRDIVPTRAAPYAGNLLQQDGPDRFESRTRQRPRPGGAFVPAARL